MAKSKSFFGLRRGSTKSLTFSIYGGKQVTKDRIAYMTNPQSYNQAVQRAIFSAAAKFYAKMKTVLDHSWEGIAYGTPSQSNFMKLALATGIGSSRAKGDKALPLNYPISRGSLPKICWNDVPEIPQTSVSARFASKLLISSTQNSVASFISNNNLVEGEQISFVGALMIEDVLQPLLIRFVLDSSISMVTDLYAQIVHTDGSIEDATVGDIFEAVAGYLTVRDTFLNGAENATWVLSRKSGNTWLRSDSDFALVPEVNKGAGIPSYTKGYTSAQNVEDSDRFLNEDEVSYGYTYKVVEKTITVGETQKTVFARVKLSTKLVKQADGSVISSLLIDDNEMLIGNIDTTPCGYKLTGSLVEGAAEDSLIIKSSDLPTENKESLGYYVSNVVSVNAFQYTTA